jgi:lipoprotein-releasing system permease protein
MRPFEWLALVAITACSAKHPEPTQQAVAPEKAAKAPWNAPAGSAAGEPKWVHDPPAVLRDKILSVNAHVFVLKSNADFAEYRETLALAERTRGVTAAEPFIYVELAIAKAGKPPVGIAVKGVDPSRVGRVLAIGPHMKTGTLELLGTKGEPPPIILGDDLARVLDARVGDTVTITSRDDAPAGVPPIKPAAFHVAGLFHLDFDEYDERLALAPLLAVQTMVGRGDQVMGIEMTVSDLGHSDEVAKALEKALGGPPYHAIDWYELNKNLFTALFGDRRP